MNLAILREWKFVKINLYFNTIIYSENQIIFSK